MQWHEFVFSEKKEKRLLRHLIFWLAWWLYFSYCDYLLQQPTGGFRMNPIYVTTGAHILSKTLLLVLIYATASYVFINLILPAIIQAKWREAMIGLSTLGICLLAAGYLLFWYAFPFVDSFFAPYRPNHFATWFWPAVYLGLVNPVKVVAAAGIIKYVKYLWLKQKESERLEREKIDAELQLLKDQVHPDFLLNTLNTIYDHALSSSPHASAMLLKLSDLLSYMLYECEGSVVPLEREVSMMREYMEIEEMRRAEKPEVEITVKGNLDGKQIAPFLLLPFIRNSFNHFSKVTDQPWINMELKIDEDLFSMKLANGAPENMNEPPIEPVILSSVQKRLSLLYEGNYELKIASEQEMIIVILTIYLNDTSSAFLKEEVGRIRGHTKKVKAILDYDAD